MSLPLSPCPPTRRNSYLLRCYFTSVASNQTVLGSISATSMIPPRPLKWKNHVTSQSPTLQLTRPLKDTGLEPRLPPELCDRIIDHLHDDQHALGMCCLTSRSWVPASRFHRFHKVYLTPVDAGSFLRLLQSAPPIAHYVKRLVVCIFPLHIRNLQSPVKSHLLVLKHIMLQLHQVTTLGVPDLIVLPEIISMLSTLAPSVKEIDFGELRIPNAEYLSRMLSSFSKLERIRISDRTAFTGLRAFHSVTPFQLPTSLHCVQLSLPSKGHALYVVRWLVSHSQFQLLRELSLFAYVVVSGTALVALFRALGPSLESLNLMLPRKTSMKDLTFELSRCTNLHTITFTGFPVCRCEFGVHCEHSMTHVPVWASAFLSKVKTSSIRIIVFRLSLRSAVDLRDLSWIEDVILPLSNPEFIELQTVTFQLVGGECTRIFRGFVKREMPDLLERGILSIQDVLPGKSTYTS